MREMYRHTRLRPTQVNSGSDDMVTSLAWELTSQPTATTREGQTEATSSSVDRQTSGKVGRSWIRSAKDVHRRLQMGNGWYILDELHGFSVSLCSLGTSVYPPLVSSCLRAAISSSTMRRGMGILRTARRTKDAYADLFDLSDGRQITGQLARLG